MNERRKSPRMRCRLGCRVERGRDRIRARVLDVSEGGLCVLSPVELEKGYIVKVMIDIPSHGPVEVQSRVWHVRKNRNPTTQAIVWSVGMLLLKADAEYRRLLPHPQATAVEDDGTRDETDQFIAFRVRVQVRGEPRTRLLNLAASSEEEARRLALLDLDDSWSIVEVRQVPASN